MTDRELLELAAKAAGLTLEWGGKYKLGDDEIDCTDISYVRSGQPDEGDVHWNPLTDDGDALRLAVKLGLSLLPYPVYREDSRHSVVVKQRRSGDTLRELNPTEALEPYNDDPLAATRRAIVRSAAEIGRSMA